MTHVNVETAGEETRSRGHEVVAARGIIPEVEAIRTALARGEAIAVSHKGKVPMLESAESRKKGSQKTWAPYSSSLTITRHMKLCWYPREFDSTLGYPGEGPPHPTLRVATYNVAGLKMDLTISEHYCRKSKALLTWARDKKIDVLFIQEHNCSKNEFGRMRVLTNMFGYTVTLASRRRAPGEDDISRGGAAILTRKLSFPAGAEEDEYQETHGGRLAKRSVVWEDMVIELASIYVPASARERKIFINKLLQDNPLNS